MALTLYLHPLASFCHKVLIGLYENGVNFTPITVDLADPASTAPLLAEWPAGKIPVLHDSDGDRSLPETTIILEYLHLRYPGPVKLFPADPEGALEVRLWDRFFDLYIHQPMQKIVIDRLRAPGTGDALGVSEAYATLDTAYEMVETRMAGRHWAAGEAFSLADCAASPALFYAGIIHPFGPNRPVLSAYFERLMARASIARTISEARPYFQFFPFSDAIPARFLAA
ncbi:MAG: glutathione S-transferase [Cereibacter sphaeroides]|uniref:Glutathione S-transferase n=1 Tax=Cereibacter sphaeroides TaxID=1063 RepID=A0A2W5S1N4_CERSP|nr:MAG: glutathione S-transferase [Cereibacter sphaeroides]